MYYQSSLDVFGVAAQEVKSVLLGEQRTPLALTPGRGNDNKPIVAGTNFVVREIPA